jgi:hypothetical protein
MRLYGYPVQRPEPGGPVVFQKYGLFIIIEFFDGDACAILFSKGAIPGQPGVMPLSDREVAAVMNANGFKRKWLPPTKSSAGTMWITEDGEIISLRQASDGSLIVWTREALLRNRGAIPPVEPKPPRPASD